METIAHTTQRRPLPRSQQRQHQQQQQRHHQGRQPSPRRPSPPADKDAQQLRRLLARYEGVIAQLAEQAIEQQHEMARLQRHLRKTRHDDDAAAAALSHPREQQQYQLGRRQERQPQAVSSSSSPLRMPNSYNNIGGTPHSSSNHDRNNQRSSGSAHPLHMQGYSASYEAAAAPVYASAVTVRDLATPPRAWQPAETPLYPSYAPLTHPSVWASNAARGSSDGRTDSPYRRFRHHDRGEPPVPVPAAVAAEVPAGASSHACLTEAQKELLRREAGAMVRDYFEVTERRVRRRIGHKAREAAQRQVRAALAAMLTEAEERGGVQQPWHEQQRDEGGNGPDMVMYASPSDANGAAQMVPSPRSHQPCAFTPAPYRQTAFGGLERNEEEEEEAAHLPSPMLSPIKDPSAGGDAYKGNNNGTRADSRYSRRSLSPPANTSGTTTTTTTTTSMMSISEETTLAAAGGDGDYYDARTRGSGGYSHDARDAYVLAAGGGLYGGGGEVNIYANVQHHNDNSNGDDDELYTSPELRREARRSLRAGSSEPRDGSAPRVFLKTLTDSSSGGGGVGGGGRSYSYSYSGGQGISLSPTRLEGEGTANSNSNSNTAGGGSASPHPSFSLMNQQQQQHKYYAVGSPHLPSVTAATMLMASSASSPSFSSAVASPSPRQTYQPPAAYAYAYANGASPSLGPSRGESGCAVAARLQMDSSSGDDSGHFHPHSSASTSRTPTRAQQQQQWHDTHEKRMLTPMPTPAASPVPGRRRPSVCTTATSSGGGSHVQPGDTSGSAAALALAPPPPLASAGRSPQQQRQQQQQQQQDRSGGSGLGDTSANSGTQRSRPGGEWLELSSIISTLEGAGRHAAAAAASGDPPARIGVGQGSTSFSSSSSAPPPPPPHPYNIAAAPYTSGASAVVPPAPPARDDSGPAASAPAGDTSTSGAVGELIAYLESRISDESSWMEIDM